MSEHFLGSNKAFEILAWAGPPKFGGAEHDGDLRIDWGGRYGGVISISSVLETGPLYRLGPTRR